MTDIIILMVLFNLCAFGVNLLLFGLLCLTVLVIFTHGLFIF